MAANSIFSYNPHQVEDNSGKNLYVSAPTPSAEASNDDYNDNQPASPTMGDFFDNPYEEAQFESNLKNSLSSELNREKENHKRANDSIEKAMEGNL